MFLQEGLPQIDLLPIFTLIQTLIAVVIEDWVIEGFTTILTTFGFNILASFFGFGDSNWNLTSPFAWGLMLILIFTAAGVAFYKRR